MSDHPTPLWMDFITGRITHEALIEHVRRQHDSMDCPATGGRHTEHRCEPNQNGEGAIYCTNCGYRWSYRNRSQAELDAHDAMVAAHRELVRTGVIKTITVHLTPEQAAEILSCPGQRHQGHKL